MDPVRSERYIEYEVSEYAEKVKGCLVLKLNVWGRIGWPDRLYIHYRKVMFVEFKKDRAVPRKIQDYIHGKIRDHGIPVRVVDNVSDGKAIIDQFTEGSTHV